MKLTLKETALMDKLSEFWNQWLELDQLHEDDDRFVRDSVHNLQRLVLSRPMVRELSKPPAVPQGVREFVKGIDGEIIEVTTNG